MFLSQFLLTEATYSIPCTKKYIHLIRKGEKSVEGRLFYTRFRKLVPGLHLRLYYLANKNDDAVCEVISTHVYTTFHEMLSSEGISNCIPGETDLEKGAKLYHSFPNYSKRESELGVIAIRIKFLYSNTNIGRTDQSLNNK